MNRRTALATLGTVVGYIYGRPVKAQNANIMLLALDGVDVIEVRYRGQRVFVNPAEVMAALDSPSNYVPQMQQAPRR